MQDIPLLNLHIVAHMPLQMACKKNLIIWHKKDQGRELTDQGTSVMKPLAQEDIFFG